MQLRHCDCPAPAALQPMHQSILIEGQGDDEVDQGDEGLDADEEPVGLETLLAQASFDTDLICGSHAGMSIWGFGGKFLPGRTYNVMQCVTVPFGVASACGMCHGVVSDLLTRHCCGQGRLR
jgi:hypothetical protein